MLWRQRHAIYHMLARLDADANRLNTRTIHVPILPVIGTTPQPHYMQWSTCSAADFLDPRFHAVCAALGHVPRFHRKLWEFVYVFHHLEQAGMLAPGRRGIGFGVGTEPMPAAFAACGAEILATDAPPALGVAAGWAATAQFASGLDTLPRAGLCPEHIFRRNVSFRPVDMTAIPADLAGFDFCWSACCFEHLGSLQAGLDFVRHTVEHVLAQGGIAVHTTEFNLSSDDATLETGGTVIYRRRDIIAFIAEMQARGHIVSALAIAPDTHHMDGWVDIAPYSNDAHLKLALGQYTCTSVGLVIQRGR